MDLEAEDSEDEVEPQEEQPVLLSNNNEGTEVARRGPGRPPVKEDLRRSKQEIICPINQCGKKLKNMQGYLSHAWLEHKFKSEQARQELARALGIEKDTGAVAMTGPIPNQSPTMVGDDFVDVGDKTRLRGEIRRLVNLTRKLSREDREDLLPEIETAQEYLRDLGNRKIRMTVQQFEDIRADFNDNIKPAVEDLLDDVKAKGGSDLGDLLGDADDQEFKDLRKQERSLEREEEKEVLRLKLQKRKKELEKQIEEMNHPRKKEEEREESKAKPTKMIKKADGSVEYEMSGGDGNTMMMMMLMQMMNQGQNKGPTYQELQETMNKQFELLMEKNKKSPQELELERQKMELEARIREQERMFMEKRFVELERKMDRPSDFETYQYYKRQAQEMGLEGHDPVQAQIQMDLEKTKTSLGLLAQQVNNLNQNVAKVVDTGTQLVKDAAQKNMQQQYKPMEAQQYDVTQSPPVQEQAPSQEPPVPQPEQPPQKKGWTPEFIHIPENKQE